MQPLQVQAKEPWGSDAAIDSLKKKYTRVPGSPWWAALGCLLPVQSIHRRGRGRAWRPLGAGAARRGYFLALAELRGGVMGRPPGFRPLNCPYLPLFLSAGFRICKTQEVRLVGRSQPARAPPQPARGPLLPHSHLEGAHEGLVHTHHGACVVKLAAVVGS